MELLARKTLSEPELNHLALLQHAIFSGVIGRSREPLDGEYVMSEIQRLIGVAKPHQSTKPSPWELDTLQRQLTAKLETIEYVQFSVIVGELREVLAKARRKALETRTQQVRSGQAQASSAEKLLMGVSTPASVLGLSAS